MTRHVRLHRWLLALVLVGVPAAVGAQTEEFSRTVPLAAGGEFRLSNVSGDITVTGTGGRNVVIDAIKRLRRGDADELDEVTIEIDAEDDRVEVETRYPRDRRRGPRVSVDYRVGVPRDVRVEVVSVSGNIRLSGIDEETRGQTVSGNVELSAISRPAEVRTVSGNIEIRDVSDGDEIEAQTVSGRVEADGIRTDRLAVNTVSGRVLLRDVTSRRTDVGSVSGRIQYDGALAPDGRYEFQSHSGRIRLELDPSVGFDLEAETFSGRVVNEFPDAGNGTRSRFPGRTYRFRHGDGAAEVQVTTFSGTVELEPR